MGFAERRAATREGRAAWERGGERAGSGQKSDAHDPVCGGGGVVHARGLATVVAVAVAHPRQRGRHAPAARTHASKRGMAWCASLSAGTSSYLLGVHFDRPVLNLLTSGPTIARQQRAPLPAHTARGTDIIAMSQARRTARPTAAQVVQLPIHGDALLIPGARSVGLHVVLYIF